MQTSQEAGKQDAIEHAAELALNAAENVAIVYSKQQQSHDQRNRPNYWYHTK